MLGLRLFVAAMFIPLWFGVMARNRWRPLHSWRITWCGARRFIERNEK
jgi:hypothetical protein